MYFFCIPASAALIAADNPKGANMFFPTEIAGFINLGNNLPKIDPKAPPDFTNFLFVLCLILYQLTCCFQLYLLI